MDGIRIDTLVQGNQCQLSVHGEVDVGSADDLVAIGRLSLNDTNVASLLIDLAGVTFIDSTGIGALVQLQDRAIELGKHLRLGNPHPRVTRILTITGLNTVFDVDAPAAAEPIAADTPP